VDRTSLIYVNVWLKDTASFFVIILQQFLKKNVLYEYKNKSAIKGAQLMPIVLPTNCWKTWSPKTTYNVDIVYKKAKHAFNVCFRVLVSAIRNISHKI
jgi:hypothetical protein